MAFKTLPKEQRLSLLRLLSADEGLRLETSQPQEELAASDSVSSRFWLHLKRECGALGIHLCSESGLNTNERRELSKISKILLASSPGLPEHRKVVVLEVFLARCAAIIAQRMAAEGERIFGRPSTFVLKKAIPLLDRAFPGYRSNRLLHLVIGAKNVREERG